MTDEQAEQGRTLLRELKKKKQMRAEAEEAVELEHPQLVKKLRWLEEQRTKTLEEFDDKVATTKANLREADADMYAAMDEFDEDINKLTKQLKLWAKELPDEQLKATQRLEVEGAKLTIAKVSLDIMYDDRALLKEIPELYNLKVDGDPAVIETLNVPVVERLLAEGSIDKNIVEKYRKVVRTKAPSVRIDFSDPDA